MIDGDLGQGVDGRGEPEAGERHGGAARIRAGAQHGRRRVSTALGSGRYSASWTRSKDIGGYGETLGLGW